MCYLTEQVVRRLVRRIVAAALGFAMFLFCIGGERLLGADRVDETRDLLNQLKLTDRVLAEIDAAVQRLDSDSFAERYLAFVYLSRLPMLPRERMGRAVLDGSLEQRIRLAQVFKVNTPESADARLEEVMARVSTGKLEGLLAEVLAALEGRDYSGGTRWDACVAACETTAQAADVDRLKVALESETAVVRGGAAVALIKVLGKEAELLLAGLVDDPDDQIKLIAADYLRSVGSRECLRAYAALLSAGGNEGFTVRWRSLDALRQITGQDFEFYAAAEEAERLQPAKDWARWVAENAATAELNFEVGKPRDLVLFDGKDLDGWKEVKGFFQPGAVRGAGRGGWVVEDGILVCQGGAQGHLRTTGAFKDYLLKLEYRTPGGLGDSGVGLFVTGPDKVAPRCLEVQVLSGRSGDIYQIGGFEAVGANGEPIAFQSQRIAEPKEDPDGWNRMELKVIGGTLEVTVNGVVVNRASGCPEEETMISLRNEGSRVEYRNLLLVPLD